MNRGLLTSPSCTCFWTDGRKGSAIQVPMTRCPHEQPAPSAEHRHAASRPGLVRGQMHAMKCSRSRTLRKVRMFHSESAPQARVSLSHCPAMHANTGSAGEHARSRTSGEPASNLTCEHSGASITSRSSCEAGPCDVCPVLCALMSLEGRVDGSSMSVPGITMPQLGATSAA